MAAHRLKALQVLLLLALTATATARHQSIVDPSAMDGDLTKCGASAEDDGAASCGAERECEKDANDSGDDVCLHEQLLPLSPRDAYGTAALLCGLCLAASAGIGGGGLNVPILLLIFNFEMDEAVVLSNAAVMGNGLAQILINFGRRHPNDPTKTLIDWDAVLVLLPAQLAGGDVGVVAGAGVPATLLATLSCALLFVAAAKTLFKARKQFNAETGAAPPLTNGAGPPLSSVVPWTNVGAVLAFVGLFSVDAILLKSSRKCSPVYWLSFAATFPFVVGLAVWTKRRLSRRSAASAVASEVEAPSVGDGDATLRQTLLGDDDDETPPKARTPDGDVDWAAWGTRAPLVASFIGLLSALLGLGGGELLGPVLLGLGMMPARSSATTATTSLLSTLANFAHYAAQGELRRTNFLPYALWVAACGLVAGSCGRRAALALARRGRASAISAALGVVLTVSLGLMMFDATTDGGGFAFQGFC